MPSEALQQLLPFDLVVANPPYHPDEGRRLRMYAEDSPAGFVTTALRPDMSPTSYQRLACSLCCP
eukprot:CAMPEP_0177559430 /NCGR_PEP_ID=MMETSP0369-20130122/70832_1 /TAXON_ID=447022 ORGANISM="Scrippsiella hangoei-like, Strain SHHI-4" /NCGR_SAMPLE_ID=MMETSP0369 /ASSEMBLY_ACC=CAM_ASM_000364 /LENGTH=64 /DNA_ID=CAMNT_0019046159 /DNA_START=42 /DNA_END=232 /DNA_ORIENTATION=+